MGKKKQRLSMSLDRKGKKSHRDKDKKNKDKKRRSKTTEANPPASSAVAGGPASSAVAVGQASSGKLAKLAKRAELGWKVLEESGKRKPAAEAAEHLDSRKKLKKKHVVNEPAHGASTGHAGLAKMQDKGEMPDLFDLTSDNEDSPANASCPAAAVAALLQPVKEERGRSPPLPSFEDDEESNRTKFESPLPDEVEEEAGDSDSSSKRSRSSSSDSSASSSSSDDEESIPPLSKRKKSAGERRSSNRRSVSEVDRGNSPDPAAEEFRRGRGGVSSVRPRDTINFGVFFLEDECAPYYVARDMCGMKCEINFVFSLSLIHI